MCNHGKRCCKFTLASSFPQRLYWNYTVLSSTRSIWRPPHIPEVLRKWKNPQANFKKIFQELKTLLFKERESHFHIQQIKDWHILAMASYFYPVNSRLVTVLNWITDSLPRLTFSCHSLEIKVNIQIIHIWKILKRNFLNKSGIQI